MEITVNRKIEYVDDTLLLANKEDTIFIFHKFNFFNKNLKLTIGYFDDNNIHFYIIQSTKKTDLYYKLFYTGQYFDIKTVMLM